VRIKTGLRMPFWLVQQGKMYVEGNGVERKTRKHADDWCHLMTHTMQ
jgi:hypothetical protein